MTTTAQENLQNAKSAVKETANKVKGNAQDATQEISDLLADLRDMIAGQSFSASPDFAKFKQRLEDGVANLRDRVTDVAEQSGRQIKEVSQKANTYAHNQPWQLAGAALAVGALVGMLIARR